ncbi:MAG: hypothetical protein KDA80_17555 [Planctomycetaceae bacterium]|nr:hypothetical protein [Planctomycetaceae bacterium]
MPAPLEAEQRVLTLLRMLGEEVRVSVLDSLPDELRQRLRKRLTNSRAKYPSKRRQQQILDEFQWMFQWAVQFRGPQLRLHNEQDEPEEDENAHYSPTGVPEKDLERINLFQLSEALESEHPRTVALLLGRLAPRRVAQILEQISPEHRSRIVNEMAKTPDTPDHVWEKIARTTVEQAAKLPSRREPRVDPIIRMADILRETEKPRRRELLESIEEQDAQTALALHRAIYRFDDLLELNDRKVQRVLALIDSNTLRLALSDASPEIIETVIRNLSRKAGAALREELNYQMEVAEPERTAARDQVAEAIGKVEGESS